MTKKMQNDAVTSPQAMAQQLMPDAALQLAMREQLQAVGDARVYAVREEWQRVQLRAMDMLKHASHGSELERLARDSNTKAIYIPADSAMPLALVCDVLSRTATDVPVFMEQA